MRHMVIYLRIIGVLALLAGFVLVIADRWSPASLLVLALIGILISVPHFVIAHVLNSLSKVNNEHITRLYERNDIFNKRLTALEAREISDDI